MAHALKARHVNKDAGVLLVTAGLDPNIAAMDASQVAMLRLSAGNMHPYRVKNVL